MGPSLLHDLDIQILIIKSHYTLLCGFVKGGGHGCCKVRRCEEPRLWATKQSPALAYVEIASAQTTGLAMTQDGMPAASLITPS
jgi:hypothetical protein